MSRDLHVAGKERAQSVNCKSIIHLIDDDQAMLDALSLLLKIEGYTIRTYNSAQSFFDINKEHECGCVLTDMHMPEMSGLDLLAAMKERGASLPIIVITAHGNIRLENAVMELGAFDFFEKPFDDDALLSSVRAALTLHGHKSCRSPQREISQGL